MEKFTILKVGQNCPKCKEIWGKAEGRIKVYIECDSFCTFRAECQAFINANGLEGFRCKDRRWGPELGARCENNMPWHGGCKFALNSTYQDRPIVSQWHEGYPHSWDGWS